MQILKRVRLFEVSFKPPTDHSCRKVRIKDLFHNKSVLIPSRNNLDQDALDFLGEKGIEVIIDASDCKCCYYFGTEDFETPIK